MHPAFCQIGEDKPPCGQVQSTTVGFRLAIDCLSQFFAFIIRYIHKSSEVSIYKNRLFYSFQQSVLKSVEKLLITLLINAFEIVDKSG